MGNRIYSINVDVDALRDLVTATRQRANILHGLSDDCPNLVARNHWREAGRRYDRLSNALAADLEKAMRG